MVSKIDEMEVTVKIMAQPGNKQVRLEAQFQQDLLAFQEKYPLRSVASSEGPWTYRRSGSNDNRLLPVILLPGIQCGADAFYAIFADLAANLDLIAVNAPDLTEVSAMDDGLLQFLNELDLDCVDIVGSSLGAYLAQSFAASHPEKLRRLVIANGFIDPSPALASLPPAKVVSETDAADLSSENTESMREASDSDEGQLRLKVVTEALVGPFQTLENYKSRLLLMMQGPPLAPLDLMPGQIMIIDNDDDPMLPAVMRNPVRERYARSEQHQIDGGGHLPAIQRPAEFAELLRRHLIAGAD